MLPLRGWLGLLLLVPLLLAGCQSPAGPAPPPQPSPVATSGLPSAPTAPALAAAAPTPPALTRARIAYTAVSPAFLTHFVAEGLGIYQQYGIASESLQASPTVSIPGLLAGEIDYVLSTGSLMRAAAKGAPVRALGVDLPKPFFFLVTRADVQDGSALRGRVLGVTGYGSNSNAIAESYVSAFGLDPRRDVRYVNIGDSPLLWQALLQGLVDGAPLTPPYPALAERQGLRLLASPDILPLEYPSSGVGTSLDKIATQRDVAKRLLQAHLATLQVVQSERDAVIDVIVQRFAFEPDVAAATYDQLRPLWSPDDRISRESVETLQRLDVESGALAAPVPYEQIVDDSLLEEARREMAR